MALPRTPAIPDEVKAFARACSSADNQGDDTQWEVWLGFATALWEAFPDDHVVVTRRSYQQLSRGAMRADPERMALMDELIAAVKELLREFLDPGGRAIALGRIANVLRKLDSIDFHKEDRRGH